MGDNPEIGSNIDVSGTAVNYHDQGTGEPVVLIHGSGPGVSAWANWRFTVPALARRFRVIAPDIAGFGYTTVPDQFRYSRAAWTDQVIGLADALDLEQVSIVGNSFGGALALSVAARYPRRVKRLVLMGSVGISFPITPGLDTVWGLSPSLERLREAMPLFVYDRSRITEDLVGMRHEAFSRPGIAEAYAAMFPAPRQQWVDALALDEDDLRSLPHETLIVHGRDDVIVPLTASFRLAELIERCDLHVFGHCGHWVQIEAASRFNELVAEFLARGLG